MRKCSFSAHHLFLYQPREKLMNFTPRMCDTRCNPSKLICRSKKMGILKFVKLYNMVPIALKRAIFSSVLVLKLKLIHRICIKFSKCALNEELPCSKIMIFVPHFLIYYFARNFSPNASVKWVYCDK